MENNSVCSTSSPSISPVWAAELEKELKKRGLRVGAEPFIPGEGTGHSPAPFPISPVVNEASKLSTLNSKVGSDSVFPKTSQTARSGQFSAAKYSVAIDNDVVLNRVAVPDNVANNENLLLDLLGEGDESDYCDDDMDETEQMRTAEGAYWGAVGPQIPTHFYSRQIGATSILSTSFDNLTDCNEEMHPPSSIQSVVDLDQDFKDFDLTSSDSLDSEQIEWVEEQLVAGNPKTDGYFK